jgi:hypothetical protein
VATGIDQQLSSTRQNHCLQDTHMVAHNTPRPTRTCHRILRLKHNDIFTSKGITAFGATTRRDFGHTIGYTSRFLVQTDKRQLILSDTCKGRNRRTQNLTHVGQSVDIVMPHTHFAVTKQYVLPPERTTQGRF